MVDAEPLPFWVAHLVEPQDLDQCHGLRFRADAGNPFHIVVGVGQSWDLYEANPRRLPEIGRPAGTVERRLQRLARDLEVDLLVAELDVEQVQVDVHEVGCGESFTETSRGVEEGVHAVRICVTEDSPDEVVLL